MSETERKELRFSSLSDGGFSSKARRLKNWAGGELKWQLRRGEVERGKTLFITNDSERLVNRSAELMFDINQREIIHSGRFYIYSYRDNER